MQCPSCGQENQPGAAYCLRCGTQLGEPNPSAASPPGDQPASASAARETAPSPPVFPEASETELTHRGHIFGLGYGPDFYAVWDLRVAGEPVARFERTAIGWEAAWRRFQELDTQYAVPAWRRPAVGWIILHVLIGFVGTAFVQGVALGAVLVATGRADADPSPRAAAAITLSVFAGLVAWLMFVYLNKSRRVRWRVFLAMLLGGFTLALVVSLVDLPPA